MKLAMLCLGMAWTLAAFGQALQTPQQAMTSCASEAGTRKGEERKAFMKECLSSRPPALDQSGKPAKPPCEGSSANDAMRCSEPDRQRSENELNSRYAELREKLKSSGLAHLEPRLVQAQLDWEKYRESHCNFVAVSQVEGNSWTSYYQALCMSSEAQSRSEYLRRVLP